MEKQLSIVQTLYFNTTGDPLNNCVRFLSPEFHWMSWTLSCLQLKKIYGKVSLYTNKVGAEVLINRLGLPYDYVDIRLDDIEFYPGMGVLPKVYTYSFQKEPFLHFDGDVFIWENLKSDLVSLPLIVQNKERADFFYRKIYKDLLDQGTWFPKCINSEIASIQPIRVFNTGIIGGNDIGLFKKFTDSAFEIINRNKFLLPFISNGDFNLTYEQHLLYCIAKECNINVGSYIDKEIIDLSFEGFADFQKIPYKKKFIHLLGLYKRDEHTCLMLARRLRNDYPEYYYRVLEECKKAKVSLYLDYYNEPSVKFNKHNNIGMKNNHLSYWDNLYEDEKKSFVVLDKVFSNFDILFRTKFKSNFRIKNVNNSLNENISIAIPYSLLKKIRNIELDILDQLIYKQINAHNTFQKIVENLKIHFKADEIESDYLTYINFLATRIRAGCEENLYTVI
jgi:hypothetical protein